MPQRKSKQNQYDVVVLGAGPAGLAAAVYAARYNLKTLVFDMGYGRSTWFQNYSNYLGFPTGVKAMKLRELGRKQAENLGVRFRMQEPAERVTPRKDGSLTVKTKRRSVTAGTVIIASGIEDTLPDFPDAVEYEGRTMYWCLLCDGHYVNGKRVLVAGKDDDGVDLTLRLRQFTRRLAFTSTDLAGISKSALAKLRKEDIPVYEGSFKRVAGRPKGFVKSVTLALTDGSEKTLPTDAIFHRLGIMPYNEVAKKLKLRLDKRGLIKVDPDTQETNVRNVYAVGDIRAGVTHQVHSATYSGSRAAIAAYRRLYDKKFRIR